MLNTEENFKSQDNRSNKLVYKSKCVALVNASETTLKKYEAMGLLNVIKHEGDECYSLDEVETLFYLPKKEIERHEGIIVDLNKKANQDDQENAAKDINNHKYTESKDAIDDKVVEFPKESTKENTTNSNNKEESLEKAKAEIENSFKSEINSLKETVAKLEADLQSVKEDRDWLRKRVENAEQKIERDQMLLMSKSETIRKLVTKRQSIFGLLLPWNKEDKE